MRENYNPERNEIVPAAVVKNELFDSMVLDKKSLEQFYWDLIKSNQPGHNPASPKAKFAHALVDTLESSLNLDEGKIKFYTMLSRPDKNDESLDGKIFKQMENKFGAHAFMEIDMGDSKPLRTNLRYEANSNVGRDKSKVVFSFPAGRLDPKGDEANEEYQAKIHEVAIKVMLDLVKQTKGRDNLLADGILIKAKESMFSNIEEIISVFKKSRRFDDCRLVISDLIHEAQEADPGLAKQISQFIKDKYQL